MLEVRWSRLTMPALASAEVERWSADPATPLGAPALCTEPAQHPAVRQWYRTLTDATGPPGTSVPLDVPSGQPGPPCACGAAAGCQVPVWMSEGCWASGCTSMRRYGNSG